MKNLAYKNRIIRIPHNIDKEEATPDKKGVVMQVKEIMTPNPACCRRESNLREVAKMMVDCNCGEVPVVENGKCIGVVTDRDIVCRTVAQGKNPLELRAGDCMTSPAVTIRSDAKADECCDLMEEHQVRRIPVIDENGECCGIVSQADIANKLSAKKTAEVVHEISAQ